MVARLMGHLATLVWFPHSAFGPRDCGIRLLQQRRPKGCIYRVLSHPLQSKQENIRFLYNNPSFSTLQIVHRALDTLAAPAQNMSVDHGGLHIRVPEKVVNSPDVMAALDRLHGS